jgi:hypothetical protein
MKKLFFSFLISFLLSFIGVKNSYAQSITAVNNSPCSIVVTVHILDNSNATHNAGTFTVGSSTNYDVLSFCQSYCTSNSLIFSSIDYYEALGSNYLPPGGNVHQLCGVCAACPGFDNVLVTGDGNISFD